MTIGKKPLLSVVKRALAIVPDSFDPIVQPPVLYIFFYRRFKLIFVYLYIALTFQRDTVFLLLSGSLTTPRLQSYNFR
jgi:hypothetical protein